MKLYLSPTPPADAFGTWMPPFVDLLFGEVDDTVYEPLVDDILIRHRFYDHAVEVLSELDDLDRQQLPEHSVSILAPSRCGKTRLLTEFIRRRMPFWTDTGLKVPVLYIWTPETPTIKSVAGKMLREFGQSLARHETSEQMLERVVPLCVNTGVRYIVLDDLHHAVDKTGRAVQESLTNWLRELSVYTRTSLIVAGLDRVRDFLLLNEQLYARFGAPVQMPRFDWRRAEERKRFVKIIKGLYGSLATEFQMEEVDEGLAFRWYAASAGRIGMVMKIARFAVKGARRHNSRAITRDGLHKAWLKGVFTAPKAVPADRPFDETFHGNTADAVINIILASETEEPAKYEAKRRTSAKQVAARAKAAFA